MIQLKATNLTDSYAGKIRKICR